MALWIIGWDKPPFAKLRVAEGAGPGIYQLA
jgi:hypothetical protein